jgi:prepilin-type N-terminal cleavage/methylation domain-containing protein
LLKLFSSYCNTEIRALIQQYKKGNNMKHQQSGFTLVEIAIVLVIVGLLLGGVLKGQELINSAKAKSYAQDFRVIQTALYGFQDRYKGIPGDLAGAATKITNAITATTPVAAPGGPVGNGFIGGAWNTTTNTDESCLAFQHLRLAGFLAGNTTPNCATAGDAYLQTNADGGRVGISSEMQMTLPLTNPMTGSYNICSTGVLGRIAKQLDTQLDDGNTLTGSFRVAAIGTPNTALATGSVDDATSYLVCLAF